MTDRALDVVDGTLGEVLGREGVQAVFSNSAGIAVTVSPSPTGALNCFGMAEFDVIVMGAFFGNYTGTMSIDGRDAAAMFCVLRCENFISGT